MTARKVFWTTEECEAMAPIMYRELLRGETRTNALQTAMDEALDKDRHRPLKAPSGPLNVIRPYVDKVRADESARKTVRAVVSAASFNPGDVPSETPTEAEVEFNSQSIPPIFEQIRVVASQWLVDVVIGAMNDPRLRLLFLGVGAVAESHARAARAPEQRVEPTQPTQPTEKEATTAKLPNPEYHAPRLPPETIGIVGITPRHAEQLRQHYGKYFDLRFVEVGGKKPLQLGGAKSATIIYYMKDFGGPSYVSLVKSAGIPVAYISGSLSALEAALENRLTLRGGAHGFGDGELARAHH